MSCTCDKCVGTQAAEVGYSYASNEPMFPSEVPRLFSFDEILAMRHVDIITKQEARILFGLDTRFKITPISAPDITGKVWTKDIVDGESFGQASNSTLKQSSSTKEDETS